MTALTRLELDEPVYRYYTVDLLSDRILAEIPFGSVSYELGLKSAGEFSGKIPVIPTEANRTLDLYNSTMPGNTGLYVLRDGVCVWGGIIWNRKYDITTRTLDVSASEFTSYLFHRRVWKTWNHQHEATVVVSGGNLSVTFPYGVLVPLSAGSSVKFEFYEPVNMRYNGYYSVASSPAPTKYSFSVNGAVASARITSYERTGNIVTIRTEANHGFATGDSITISLGTGNTLNGTHIISAPGGTATQTFTFSKSGSDILLTEASGEATRPIPSGTYEKVTISVRTDTYDYVRNFLDAVFTDYTGIDFPNEIIEPGIRQNIDIASTQLSSGLATINTATPHNLSPGQSVTIKNAGSLYDGRHTVTSAPSPTSFQYRKNGSLALSTQAFNSLNVITVGAHGGKTVLVTSLNHGLSIGQQIYVDLQTSYIGNYPELNGLYTITGTPNRNTLVYDTGSTLEIPDTSVLWPQVYKNSTPTSLLPIIRAKLTNNVATITTGVPHGFAVNDQVTVQYLKYGQNVDQLTWDNTGQKVIVKTTEPHGLAVGDAVNVSGRGHPVKIKSYVTGGGAYNSAGILRRTTFITDGDHYFNPGDYIQATSDSEDEYEIASYSITSNVVTLTLKQGHNIGVGNTLFVRDVMKSFPIQTLSVADGIATITTSAAHGFVANNTITLRGITEAGDVVAKKLDKGIATLSLSQPHNFLPNSVITVSGVSAPYDGTHRILRVTDTEILYEVNDNGSVPITSAAGTVTSTESVFNDDFTITSTTTTAMSFVLDRNDVSTRTLTGATVFGDAPINGVFTTTAEGQFTVSYALTAPNQASTTVTTPAGSGRPPATAARRTPWVGQFFIYSVTANSFTTGMNAVKNPVTMTPKNMKFRAYYAPFTSPSALTGVAISAVPDANTFEYPYTSSISSVTLTATPESPLFMSALLYNGSKTVTAVTENTFSFAYTHANLAETSKMVPGTVTTRAEAVVASYGPYPGNANIGIEMSTSTYSGVNLAPVAYRGFELTNVGEALSNYSDNIDGFEYRIDADFDPDTGKFTKSFVMLPINYPDPPLPGEVSPPSRFGADKLVFEYPGNIISLSLEESAETSANRFFAVGENDLGPDAGPPLAAATNTDLLNGYAGRPWPLLDDDEKIDDVDDEGVLHGYAARYLSESKSPDAKLSVSVNGSLQPEVGSYKPGDWCSLIVDDEFIRQRLASGQEPRSNVILRKIDAIKVSVPDGTTAPETVSLTLIPEWEVDKRG